MNTPPTDIRFRWQLLRAGPLWLDGGGMFGLVPRVLWKKSLPPDEQGRILLGHNCLLLHRADGTGGPIIIETGSGNKFDDKTKTIYGLNDHTIAEEVAGHDCPCESVANVIVSHLHFDHAGGLTRKARPGESPDWVRPSDQFAVKRTFPNAVIHVQRREWDDALINRSVMTRTYLAENLEPIRKQLQLIDSPAPFPAGYLPRRDELPPSPLSDRITEILPGISGFIVPGHTWGQQAIQFTDDRGRKIVFTPDVLPTLHHVGAAYNLAYDVEPFISTVTRHWFLREAAAQNWLLVLDHEPDHPCQRAAEDGKGWYRLTPEDHT